MGIVRVFMIFSFCGIFIEASIAFIQDGFALILKFPCRRLQSQATSTMPISKMLSFELEETSS